MTFNVYLLNMLSHPELVSIKNDQNYLDPYGYAPVANIDHNIMSTLALGEPLIYGREGTCDINTIVAIHPTPNHEGEYGEIPKSEEEIGSIMDVGGYVGGFSRYALEYDGSRPLVIFEPMESNVGMIQKNLEAYKDSIVQKFLFKFAVGYSRNVLIRGDIMSDVHKYMGGTLYDIQGKPFNEDGTDLPEAHSMVRSLDLKEVLLLNQVCTGFEDVFFMKIDCEGGEYPLFENASTEDIRKIKYIVGEFHLDNVEHGNPYNLILKHGYEEYKKPNHSVYFFRRID